jgi:hypothetical protein
MADAHRISLVSFRRIETVETIAMKLNLENYLILDKSS